MIRKHIDTTIEDIKYGLKNIYMKKIRSFLTVLSILIGIAAVYALMSFGLGIQHYITNLAYESGADKLFITAKGFGAPGTDQNFFLTKQELNFLEKRQGVKEILGVYIAPVQIKFNNQRKFAFLSGFDSDKSQLMLETGNMEVYKGRNLKSTDKNKVVLGYNYQFENKIFSKPVKLGDNVEINGQKYEVVGFYSEIGNPNDDAQIYMNEETFLSLFPEKRERYSFAIIRSERNIDPEKLAETLQDKLRRYRNQKEGQEDFFIQTFADLIETFGSIINIINSVLILISFISVVVAAVNIMNTMYTNVLERTKEIGIMKAIGARNSEILKIFLVESALLGFIGGIIGVFLGYLVASLGGHIARVSGYSSLQPIFPLELTIGCILFATFVGSISGILPSRQASNLKPVDALRYE
ncbi:MAG: FtsX-like permease family protein [Candidatus Woesearchaeota archaeon]